MSGHSTTGKDYQDRDIRLKPLVVFLVATLVVTVIAVFAMKALFDHYTRASNIAILTKAERLMESNRPTEAVLEGLGEAAIGLAQVRAEAEARLNHYRILDPEADRVQIPVARAMELMIEQNRFAVREAP
ncbi:MAG TPA: hypothetical protein PKE55_03435 [Kiritimatiellia bacterium]|nr:hypothetical protein [Kiritimatiellia bacterium]